LMQRNVLDNICFPMEISKVPRAEAKKRAMELLETVGMTDKAAAYPAQLSGGQKQRVAIARVLANNPQILLCDEATSALDPQTTRSILELLQNISRNRGITIVVITHEMSVVQQICDRVAVLDAGSLVEQGTVKEIFTSPKTEAAKRLIHGNNIKPVDEVTSKRMIRIVFDGQSSYEPVIGNVTLMFNTPVNIMYADTKDIGGSAVGEMILQLPDDQVTAQRMIDYLKERKLGVEEL
ncbi:MAG: ATP-binding cassette domain-containing protein, partial [Lachnospiraceae bacterium]|nr:ATP-binding cassette domain-containing protein [Lachnospiraceae bacterium]